MREDSCQQCGAPLKGFVCEYCGSLSRLHMNREEEQAALIEFHNIMLNAARETQANMLQNGFLPDAPDVLITAGLRCIPLIDLNDTPDIAVQAAYRRLQAIIVKLRLLPQTAEISQAVHEFERITKAYNHSDRRLGVAVTISVVIGLAVCIGLIALMLMR